MMGEKSIWIIFALTCAIFLLTPGISAESDNLADSGDPPVDITSEHPGLFEIRIVSPEMLETVRNNYGSYGIPLKVERGLYIGILTPDILYLRGDLQEENFPVRDVEKNLEENIENHLIDITFGRDNSNTELFQKSSKYLIWVDAMYHQSDLLALRTYIDLINDISQTTTFEDEEIALPSYQPNYYPIPYIYYKISIVDKDLFQEKLDDRDSATEQVIKNKKGESVALIRKDQVYLLDSMRGKERDHLLLKSLLFSMGFHGESKQPDSFFNPDNNEQTSLSDLDQKAIELMYGGRLQSGMDIDTIRKTLGVET